MRINILSFVLLFSSIVLHVATQPLSAQTQPAMKIRGNVADSTDRKPLAYVNIFNTLRQMSAVSNEEGTFELDTDTLPLTLVVSSMGYQSKTITINEATDKLDLHLRPATISLDTVSIGGNEALRLLGEVFRKAVPQATKKHYSKAYIRQFAKEGDVFTGLQEVFFQGQWQNFAMTAWHPLQGRYANLKKSMIGYKNFSFFSFMATGYLPSNVITTPINRKPDSLYHCVIERYISNDAEKEIAVVKCIPKDHESKNLFSGDIYIDTKTFDVWKLDGQVVNFSFDLSGPLKLKDTEVRILINLKKNEDGSCVLDFAELRFDSKATFGFVTAKKLAYSAKILMYDYDDSLSKASYTIITPKMHDAEVMKKIPYDSKFWKNNPLIPHTPLEEEIISSFENQKLITNYLQ